VVCFITTITINLVPLTTRISLIRTAMKQRIAQTTCGP